MSSVGLLIYAPDTGKTSARQLTMACYGHYAEVSAFYNLVSSDAERTISIPMYEDDNIGYCRYDGLQFTGKHRSEADNRSRQYVDLARLLFVDTKLQTQL